MKLIPLFFVFFAHLFSETINFVAPFCPLKWLSDNRAIYDKHKVVCFCPEHRHPGQKIDLDSQEKFILYDLSFQGRLSDEMKKKCILINAEPRFYSAEFFENFHKVYTWNDQIQDGEKFCKFFYPHLASMINDRPSFHQKKMVCMIASNWVEHRIQALNFFLTKKNFLDVYGKDIPIHFRYSPIYKGSIDGDLFGESKHNVMKQYRFCLCFENTVVVPGYITEKIFSCFVSGCVPIYWGASNVESYISTDCFIDYRDFQSYEDLCSFLENMDEQTYENYIHSIQNFLKSDMAQRFSSNQYENMLLEAIESN